MGAGQWRKGRGDEWEERDEARSKWVGSILDIVPVKTSTGKGVRAGFSVQGDLWRK